MRTKTTTRFYAGTPDGDVQARAWIAAKKAEGCQVEYWRTADGYHRVTTTEKIGD